MTEWTGVTYRPAEGFLAGMDPRAKLLCLVIVSLSGLRAGFPGLFILTAVLAGCMKSARVQTRTLHREIRYFMVLLALVFCARLFFTPGDRPESLPWLPVSAEGALAGILVCWRLTVVIITGLLLVITTRSKEIQAAVRFLLKPVPGIPENRVATMMGLTARMIPMVLEQAGQTTDALKARGVEQRKNPVFRMIVFAVPTMRRCFLAAEKLATAMEARCYTDKRTQPALSISRSDWVAVIVIGAVGLTALMM